MQLYGVLYNLSRLFTYFPTAPVMPFDTMVPLLGTNLNQANFITENVKHLMKRYITNK